MTAENVSIFKIIVACGLLSLVASCFPNDPDMRVEDYVYVEKYNGLDDAQRERFYHTSEGSEFFPYAMFQILERADGKLLIDFLESYGFIPDPDSPDGLPIGFSVSRSKIDGMPVVGINCAACHVTELEFNGKRFRVDGGPNQVDVVRFYLDLFGAAVHAADSAEQMFHLFRHNDANDGTTSDFLEDIPHLDVLASEGPLGNAIAERLHTIIAEEKRAFDQALEKTGDALIPQILMESVDHTLFGDHVSRLDAHVEHTKDASPADDGILAGAFTSEDREDLRNVFQDFQEHNRMIRARAEYLDDLVRAVDPQSGSVAGPGRIDAFGIVRNLHARVDDEFVPCDAPVSIPHLWGTADSKWLHWNANTNSVMQRNIIQAIGTGALYDPETYDTTVDFHLMNELEELTREIEPPKWPEDILGAIDQEQAARGKVVYDNECARCHDDVTKENGLNVYPLYAIESGDADEERIVATDPHYAKNFDRPVGELSFPEAVQQLAQKIEDRYYAVNNIPEALQKKWADERRLPIEWRSPLSDNNASEPVHPVYPAKPLRGVWATAPYFHNGSMPTLYAVLMSPKEYFTEHEGLFHVGHRQFDPVHVGLVPHLDKDHDHSYDTKVTGNSAFGHMYGLDLPQSDKMDLIEYLKTL